MPHTPHRIDPERERAILELFLAQGTEHSCINCVLTSWINVGVHLISALPREEHHSLVARIAMELVTGLCTTASSEKETL